MWHETPAGLDEPLLQARQGPALDGDGQGESAQKIAQVLGKIASHGDSAEVRNAYGAIPPRMGDFDLRLVAGLRWPRRQDDGAVVQREFVIGPLHARLVAARDDDATLELIGHDGRGDAAKELESTLVARDPIRDLLGARRFRVGVVRGAEHGDKELDLDHLAGGGFDDLRLLAGVVDEALLAGAMDLAHRQAAALEPAPVDFAELGVAVAVRMLLEIFEMEQLEGDAGLAPLGMQVGAVGNGPMMRGRGRGPVDPGLQHLVAEGVDLSPIELALAFRPR